ncbi:carbohydrate ABC transporter permease [Paenibacillus protaetiae]|uniref:carbohydrate ABC transporter permease n=1 Tax=Paenibacillus protaetiae TaxID=2509456 RepID=UPI003CC662A7
MQRLIRPAVVYVLLTAAAILVVYPVLYAILQTFMTTEEASAYPPKLFPSSLYLGGVRKVMELVPIGSFIGNSFVVSAAIMTGQVIIASLAAYAFVYIRFIGSKFWFALFLSTMMVPWEVTIIPNYLTVKAWGWLDTYSALIVPFLASAFGVFLLRQYFLQLPRELYEAARMDGCSHGRHFAGIVLPLSRPIIATLAVYSFLQAWNTYLWPLLVTNSDGMRTVQIGVSMLQFEEVTAWNLVLCGITLMLLPSLLILVFGLKQLVRGIAAGAVKG